MDAKITVSTPTADLTLDIEYDVKVYGSYHPGSRDGPPEYPEVEHYIEDRARLLLKDGRWITYDLRKLPQAIYDDIDAQVERLAQEYVDHPDEGDDYDPADGNDDDVCNMDCSTDYRGRNILP